VKPTQPAVETDSPRIEHHTPQKNLGTSQLVATLVCVGDCKELSHAGMQAEKHQVERIMSSNRALFTKKDFDTYTASINAVFAANQGQPKNAGPKIVPIQPEKSSSPITGSTGKENRKVAINVIQDRGHVGPFDRSHRNSPAEILFLSSPVNGILLHIPGEEAEKPSNCIDHQRPRLNERYWLFPAGKSN
jgi:hypothetical protein